jgi:anaerobic dimethyl sulfoxide reductase subunit A
MDEKNYLSKLLSETVLSRRSFLKWSAAVGGAAAMAGGLQQGFLKAMPCVKADSDGKWVPASCWHDCGSKGFNKVFVKDGVPIFQGTDETITDSPDNPQLRACAKGRAQRDHLLSPTRLKYPMKRKNWEPGGGKKELRGRDEWVRISWDEALDIVASEFQRIKDQYGNKAFLSIRSGEPTVRLLSAFGGFVDGWGEHSGGTFSAAWHTGWGIPFSELDNDRIDLRNSQLIVLWASNPAWSRAGQPMHDLVQYKKGGAKVIVIDPFFSATAEVLADEWIPIRPATDTPLLLALSHVLLMEDDPEKNPLIDWDFLNRCTVGFDKDHMPEGADPKENYKDYVLGILDGQPKTPEWACEICGVPPEKIRQLAREIAGTERVAIKFSPAPARANNADCLPQAILSFGAMTGHLGKSGCQVGHDWGHTQLSQGNPLVTGGWFLDVAYLRGERRENPLASGFYGYFGSFWRNNRFEDDDVYLINFNELWHAVNVGECTTGYNKKRKIDIKCIVSANNNKLNQFPGTMEAVSAHRKAEFVVTQNLFFNPSAQYSDVVLPVTSYWERYGYVRMGYREQLLWTSQIMEPYFESKDDSWISVELGKRLGLNLAEIEPCSYKQNVFDHVMSARVIKEDASGFEPLVTVTEADMKEFGFEGEPQQGRIALKEFKEKGIYHVERKPGDNYSHIPYKAFRDDPENNPRDTPSGKLEIHCQSYADYVKACGWSEISPIAVYKPPLEGYEATFSDWDKKVKGEYPLQQFDLHVLRRVHSTLDNTPWLQEAFHQTSWMNPIDAEARGIKDGDTVVISSRHGKIMRNITVTNRIIPGAVAVGQGSWLNLDDELGIDKGGCVNVLHGSISTGQGHMGLNTCNVEIEKWGGEPLKDDYQLPPLVPLMEV